MKIAVDAVSGDNAPQAIVEGVMLARQDFPDIEFQLYGKEAEMKKYITDEKNVTVIHTDEKIISDDEPVKVICRKKTASMILAAQAAESEGADTIFSAGNTETLLTAGLFVVDRIKNVGRPGLMSTLPVIGEPDREFDILDLGTNASNKPEHLVQYAVLSPFYAEEVRNVQSPRVGLLNNGTEETRGSELTKKASELLAVDETINLVGNVEARELLDGVADMAMTGGFTGNAVLKSIEDTAVNMVSPLRTTILSEGVRGKMGALSLKDALRGAKDGMNYSKHGGTVLFGLKAPVIKAHGAIGLDAIHYTIRQIHTVLETQVVLQLVEYYEGKVE